MPMNQTELEVDSLGERTVSSPLMERWCGDDSGNFFNPDGERILLDIRAQSHDTGTHLSLERAGPLSKIFFEPSKTKAAIVTCGGICPGLNDVIRGLVMELYYWYGVDKVYGVRYGYTGLTADADPQPILLTPEYVSDIHRQGGTILGTSRGDPGMERVAENIIKNEWSIVFCIGGDGTLRGAAALSEHLRARNATVSVVGIPKTIDNDIPFVYRSFGFETAVEEARKVIGCAHVESKGAKNGVGLVKLMGRDAGFIAAHATLSSGDANYCMIPEMSFPLHGPDGFLEHLRERLLRRRHAVVALAEGACQSLLGESGRKDASGNKLFNDAGLFLRQEMEKAFSGWGIELNVKYFDPSYVIRSVPANGDDSVFCANLARYAADAAMAGKTGMYVGYWHGEFTHMPLRILKGAKKRIVRTERLWRNVICSTGQPASWW